MAVGVSMQSGLSVCFIPMMDCTLPSLQDNAILANVVLHLLPPTHWLSFPPSVIDLHPIMLISKMFDCAANPPVCLLFRGGTQTQRALAASPQVSK